MKKNKIFTLLSTMVLVFSIAGCNEEVEDEELTSSNDEVSESSSGNTNTSGSDLDEFNPQSVDDILNEIYEKSNYTLIIEYNETFSAYFDSLDELYDGYQDNLVTVDYFVVISYTEDAILMEYYTSYFEYYFGWCYDLELYVNDYDSNKTNIYYLDENWEFYLAGEYTGLWQNAMYSARNLKSYSTYITPGKTTTGNYGQQVSYNLTLSNYNFLRTLVYSIFYCGNWFVDLEYANGPVCTINLGYLGYSSDITYESILYLDYGEWDTALDTGTQIWHDSSVGYWVEEDVMVASIFNVDQTSIPEEYSAYLN